MTSVSYSTIVCCRWEDHKSLWREDHKSLWMLPMHPELTEVYANRGRYKFCTTSVSEQHYFNQTTCLNTSYTTNWITTSLMQQSASPTVLSIKDCKCPIICQGVFTKNNWKRRISGTTTFSWQLGPGVPKKVILRRENNLSTWTQCQLEGSQVTLAWGLGYLAATSLTLGWNCIQCTLQSSSPQPRLRLGFGELDCKVHRVQFQLKSG